MARVSKDGRGRHSGLSWFETALARLLTMRRESVTGAAVPIPFSRISELKIGNCTLPRRANHWHWSAQPAPP